MSSSSARRNAYFSLEATTLVLMTAYVPGTVLCALHRSTLLILTKPSGSQPKVISHTPISQGDTWQYLETFLIVATGGLLLASSRQQAGILLNTLQRAGQPPYNTELSSPDVNSAEAKKPCNDPTR